MGMAETRKDIHSKSAGEFVRSWLKVQEKVEKDMPMVLWREVVGSLAVLIGAAVGIGLGVLAASLASGIVAFIIWLVVSTVVCTFAVWPGKKVLEQTRCRIASFLIIWLIPILVLGTIAASIAIYG